MRWQVSVNSADFSSHRLHGESAFALSGAPSSASAFCSGAWTKVRRDHPHLLLSAPRSLSALSVRTQSSIFLLDCSSQELNPWKKQKYQRGNLSKNNKVLAVIPPCSLKWGGGVMDKNNIKMLLCSGSRCLCFFSKSVLLEERFTLFSSPRYLIIFIKAAPNYCMFRLEYDVRTRITTGHKSLPRTTDQLCSP